MCISKRHKTKVSTNETNIETQETCVCAKRDLCVCAKRDLSMCTSKRHKTEVSTNETYVCTNVKRNVCIRHRDL